jgi:hypothetical protein
LLQVFSEALQANGITDTKQVQAMLDDIQQQKARNFAQCMEKQKAAMQQQGNQQEPADSQEEESHEPAGAPEARRDDDGESLDLIADKDQNDSSEGSDSDDHDDEEKA